MSDTPESKDDGVEITFTPEEWEFIERLATKDGRDPQEWLIATLKRGLRLILIEGKLPGNN